MTKAWLLILFCLLLIPSAQFAQTAAANKSWPKFYAAFQAAVNKHDRAALKGMISSSFNADPDLANPTPDEVVNGLDRGKMGGWRQLQKDVAAGVFTFHGRRFTKKTYFYFDYGKDRQWYWSGWMPEFEGT